MGFLILTIMAIPTIAVKTQKTGLDVYIESLGFTLIDYHISDKYTDFDKSKFVILDIVIADVYNNQYSYTWVMTYERYLERREKV